MVPFHKIIRLMKEETGQHFPEEPQMRAAAWAPKPLEAIHAAACQTLIHPVDMPVAADDGPHYAVEELIVDACITIWKAQQDITA